MLGASPSFKYIDYSGINYGVLGQNYLYVAANKPAAAKIEIAAFTTDLTSKDLRFQIDHGYGTSAAVIRFSVFEEPVGSEKIMVCSHLPDPSSGVVNFDMVTVASGARVSAQEAKWNQCLSARGLSETETVFLMLSPSKQFRLVFMKEDVAVGVQINSQWSTA